MLIIFIALFGTLFLGFGLKFMEIYLGRDRELSAPEAPKELNSIYDCPVYDQFNFEAKLIEAGIMKDEERVLCDKPKCDLCGPVKDKRQEEINRERAIRAKEYWSGVRLEKEAAAYRRKRDAWDAQNKWDAYNRTRGWVPPAKSGWQVLYKAGINIGVYRRIEDYDGIHYEVKGRNNQHYIMTSREFKDNFEYKAPKQIAAPIKADVINVAPAINADTIYLTGDGNVYKTEQECTKYTDIEVDHLLDSARVFTSECECPVCEEPSRFATTGDLGPN